MSGYKFHGGCHGCINPIRLCPDCCYMEPDWKLPNLNDSAERERAERKKWKEIARKAKRDYERKKKRGEKWI